MLATSTVEQPSLRSGNSNNLKSDIGQCSKELTGLNEQLSKNAVFILSLKNQLEKLTNTLNNKTNEASSCFEVDLQKLDE